MNGTVSNHVRALSHQMPRFNVNGLVRISKKRGTLMVKFGILHFDRNIGSAAVERLSPRIAQRSTHRYRTAERGVSGKLLSQIGAPQRVQIDMIHLHRNVRRIISAHADTSRQGKRAAWKFGVPAYAHVAPIRCGLEIQSAHEFMVKHEIAYVNRGIDHWHT